MRMQLEIPPSGLEEIGRITISLPGCATQLWPAVQPVQTIADLRILGTRFQDAPLVHPPLLARVIAQAAQLPTNMRGWGGKKVRDEETWNLPSARLLTQRALLLLCRAAGATAAHVVDRWANVMEGGDFNTPHCHYEADAAVVYFLDAGDENPAAPLDGRFQIIDSRIAFCCPSRAERPTRGIMPDMAPGTMILFPA